MSKVTQLLQMKAVHDTYTAPFLKSVRKCPRGFWVDCLKQFQESSLNRVAQPLGPGLMTPALPPAWPRSTWPGGTAYAKVQTEEEAWAPLVKVRKGWAFVEILVRCSIKGKNGSRKSMSGKSEHAFKLSSWSKQLFCPLNPLDPTLALRKIVCQLPGLWLLGVGGKEKAVPSVHPSGSVVSAMGK